mgnify:CR=1 FL=1
MSQPVSFTKTLMRLLSYGRDWKKPLTMAVLLLVMASAAQVTGPALVSYFIDHFISTRQWQWLPVLALGGGFLLLQIPAAVFNYRQSPIGRASLMVRG